MSDPLTDAIETADLDELTRWVDRLCDQRDWDALLDLRERCRRAVDRGRQLWPIASHAEYRLALEADAEHCAAVLVDGAGQMAPGPLAEVAASTHRWTDLVGHLVAGPVAALVAHERVVRGETIDEGVAYADVLDVPLQLAAWEPEYALARYRAEGGEFEAPGVAPRGRPIPRAGSPDVVAPDDATAALGALARVWATGSDGAVSVVAVAGPASQAVAAIASGRPRSAPLDPGEAIAWMAWAGASGGRRGRRRGAAAGRDLAWEALRALGGAEVGETIGSDALGSVAHELRWFWWSDDRPSQGWVLRLAVEDPVDELAWAVDARDPA